MGNWLNSDGLYIKFGADEARSTSPAGMYCTYGPEQVYEWDITLTDLTETESIQNDVTTLPDNCLITKVEVQSLVTATTGTAIDIGLVHISRDTADAEFTADPNGLWEAFITAELAVGETTIGYRGPDGLTTIPDTSVGSTAGALIGTVIAAPTLLTASRTDSTAFGAGRVLVRVHVLPRALSA